MKIVILLHLLLWLCSIVWISHHHRNPVVAAAWWLTLLALPVVGWLLYLLCTPFKSSVQRGVVVGGRYSFEHFVASLSGGEVASASKVDILHDGRQAFTQIISSLHRARRSINLGYYLILDDRLGRSLLNILERKSRAGVIVRLYYDAFGSRQLSHKAIHRLKEAGVKVHKFNPIRLPWFNIATLRRNHRKLLIVDDSVAFLGGVNIASYYIDEGDSWRDEHLRLEGEVVAQLQSLFLEDWLSVSGEGFALRKPTLHSAGEAVQLVWSSMQLPQTTMLDAVVGAISRANFRVGLCSPYLIPPQELLSAIRRAVLSGVRVQIITPQTSDSSLLDIVQRSYYSSLLDAGAELYLYEGGFMHAKYMTIDSDVAVVGTANMDCRSLNLNLEVVAIIYDHAKVLEQVATFETDIKKCRRLTADDHSVSTLELLAAPLLRLLSPQL